MVLAIVATSVDESDSLFLLLLFALSGELVDGVIVGICVGCPVGGLFVVNCMTLPTIVVTLDGTKKTQFEAVHSTNASSLNSLQTN